MTMFVIYKEEGFWSVRQFFIGPGEVTLGPSAKAHTLEEARAMIPGGLHRRPRQEQDDPNVFESWAGFEP